MLCSLQIAPGGWFCFLRQSLANSLPSSAHSWHVSNIFACSVVSLEQRCQRTVPIRFTGGVEWRGKMRTWGYSTGLPLPVWGSVGAGSGFFLAASILCVPSRFTGWKGWPCTPGTVSCPGREAALQTLGLGYWMSGAAVPGSTKTDSEGKKVAAGKSVLGAQ